VVYRSALGANKDLVTDNATGSELASVASIANLRIVITHAIASKVQGCFIWEVNL